MKHVALFSTGFTFYTAGLANALAEHLSVSVVQPRAQAEISSAILDSRVNLVSFEKPKYRRELKNVTAMNSAFSILRSLNTDIVHVQETFDYAYDLLVGFSGLNNILTTIHDLHPL